GGVRGRRRPGPGRARPGRPARPGGGDPGRRARPVHRARGRRRAAPGRRRRRPRGPRGLRGGPPGRARHPPGAGDAVTADAPAPPAVPPGPLADRLAALDELLANGRDRLGPELVGRADRLAAKAGERLRLGSTHTVVALAGTTGSGKSS